MSADTTLSKEEEEAYRNDYGSFEQLPDGDDDGDPWENSRQSASMEAASLLDHDGLARHATQSYMSVEDSTPKQSNMDATKRKSPG